MSAIDEPPCFGEDKITYCIGNESTTFALMIGDGVECTNETLISLKNIFVAQLPKMPHEYISSLVFNQYHSNIALFKNSRLIGGICYRTYYQYGFTEIAFLAVSTAEQVNGYGTKLMKYLKSVLLKNKIKYILTFADKQALGYFQKQGFSKVITLPRESWENVIKIYEGSQLMECILHPTLRYLDIAKLAVNQRAHLMDRIQSLSLTTHCIPQGLNLYRNGQKIENLEFDSNYKKAYHGNNFKLTKEEKSSNYYIPSFNVVLSVILNCDQFKYLTKLESEWDQQTSSEQALAKAMNTIVHPLQETAASDETHNANSGVMKYYRTDSMLRADLNRLILIFKNKKSDPIILEEFEVLLYQQLAKIEMQT